MNELALLGHIFSKNARLPERITVPPGDDMGAVRIGDATVLVTVDQVADGVHVRLERTAIELVGRKAITRSLSDVAAMAALPVGAVAAASLPRGFEPERADALFDAMRVTAERYGCPLFGGDVSVWDHPLLLTVTVLAEPASVKPVLRSGARVGDVICVTGRLGGAWACEEEPVCGGEVCGVSGPHLTFEPRIAAARRLAEVLGDDLHAMIDLSDGLASDLRHICEMSGVSAEVEVDRIPLRPEAEAMGRRSGKPAWHHGMCDGEDYELCFAAAAGSIARLGGKAAGVEVTEIGRVVERRQGGDVWVVGRGVELSPMAETGWEHRDGQR